MQKLLTHKYTAPILLSVLLIFTTFLYFYRLDYPYFFTDEILYINSGKEHLRGEYNNTLQAPLVGKYIAGAVGLLTENNVFLLRTPFAILGILSVFLVYKILAENLGKYWGILGGFLFLTSPILYSATRMAMLEPPMHFFWLLTHLFFLRVIRSPQKLLNYILTGVFIGFGMATKYPTAVFYPFVLIIYLALLKNKEKALNFKHLIIVYISSFAAFGFVYSHFVLKTGLSGIKLLIKENMETYLKFGSEGKPHVINGQLYSKSPWWTYIYFLYENYHLERLTLSFVSVASFIINRTFLSFYFIVFAGLSFTFMQFLEVKSARYMSSIELSIVFLTVLFLKYIYELTYKFSLKYRKSLQIALFSLVLICSSGTVTDALNQQPTEYNALFRDLQARTNNFSDGKRIYIYGSVRSAKWYARGTPEDIVISRRDLHAMCSEFKNFTYFVFDLSDLPRDPDNKLIDFVQQNVSVFTKESKYGFDIYVKSPGALTFYECRDQILN